MKKVLSFLLFISLIYGVPSTAAAQNTVNANVAVAASGQSLGIANGAHIRPVTNYGDAVNTYNSTSGKPLAIVMYFTDWSGIPNNPAVFDGYLPDQIRASVPPSNYPVIMLTWQPMNGRASEGCDKDYGTSIPLSTITQGKCDNYLREFAAELSMRPERFMLRFAHEMNITDSPWWPGHYSQDASAYVAMWKHVHDVVAGIQNTYGKHNIEWVWSINYASNPSDAWNAIPNYYPGNAYVDWIGVSGYNWYNAPGHNIPWKSFCDLFDSVLRSLASSYAKPQVLTEIGSAGSATEKAGWIQDAFSKMPQYPFLRGVVWFNDFAYASPSQADFRVINTPYFSSYPVSGQVLSAYQNAIGSSTFTSTLPALSAATPSGTVNQNKRVFVPVLKK